MTSFTKIPDDQQPVITVNPAFKISKIEDNTYGGFTEYVEAITGEQAWNIC
jgi:alpha-N-arabinofuranosidase